MVKVYAVNIKDVAVDPKWLSYLAESKRQRLLSMRDSQSLIQSLVGELLVRALAVQYLVVNNQSLIFKTNEYGKPYLFSPACPFHFSLSHSGHWVVCAVDQNPIGIDVQLIEPVDNNLAKYSLTPAEYDAFLEHSFDQQPGFFFSIWTRKESYMKLIGKGFNLMPQEISIFDNSYLISPGNLHNPGYLQEYCLESDYRLAVCTFYPSQPAPVSSADITSIINALANSA